LVVGIGIVVGSGTGTIVGTGCGSLVGGGSVMGTVVGIVVLGLDGDVVGTIIVGTGLVVGETGTMVVVLGKIDETGNDVVL
jgi:hypothetical protein